jgi:hypothetical protein
MHKYYLKFTDLCNILQLTAAAHSEVGGISFTDMQEFDQAWVLSECVLKSLNYQGICNRKTWINSLENSRSVRALEMHVNGKKLWVLKLLGSFNTKKRRPEGWLYHMNILNYILKKSYTKWFSKINFNNEKEILFEK